VFPELALTESDFKALKNAITKEFKGEETKIPVIVAGVGGRHKDKASGKVGLGFNKVVLSFFFANKWYDLEQDKHHRWKLEQSQIRQYSIASILNSRYKWWEGIHLPRRRLNFVCPNSWLTLCPLICEDMAQLEPVSSLIRGVGPTLVIAILLDGPQITERWSARYVGVLADDPGTSILTVTSLGLARRSRDKGKAENRNVVLWKDQINGWEPIELKEGRHAVVLSVVAEFREEFTADRRSDHRAAPVLVLQGWKTIGARTETVSSGEELLEESSRLVEQYDQRFPYVEKWDIEEVSIFEYLIDAVLDLDPTKFVQKFSKMMEIQTASAYSNGTSNKRLRRVAKLWDIIREASDFSREGTPVSEFESVSPEEDFPLSGQIPRQVLRSLFELLSQKGIFYDDISPSERNKNLLWNETIALIESELQSSVDRLEQEKIALEESNGNKSIEEKIEQWNFSRELHRVNNLVYLSLLWATYNRIAGEITVTSQSPRNKLDSEILGEFRKKLKCIDQLMKEHVMHESLYSSPFSETATTLV
jgi:hypothetical protein